MNNNLRKIIELEAEKYAYDQNKPMTSFERIMTYQGFISGAEFIIKKSSYEKPVKKPIKDN